jgi:hypothetical protein
MMRDSTFWNGTFARVLSSYAVAIFVLLWIGFAIALVANRGWLDQLWSWVRALPPVLEILVWVLFLPILVGLLIWQASWPVLVRLLAFSGIVGWTLLAVSSFLRNFR